MIVHHIERGLHAPVRHRKSTDVANASAVHARKVCLCDEVSVDVDEVRRRVLQHVASCLRSILKWPRQKEANGAAIAALRVLDAGSSPGVL